MVSNLTRIALGTIVTAAVKSIIIQRVLRGRLHVFLGEDGPESLMIGQRNDSERLRNGYHATFTAQPIYMTRQPLYLTRPKVRPSSYASKPATGNNFGKKIYVTPDVYSMIYVTAQL